MDSIEQNLEQLLESTSIKNIVQGIMIAESIGYDIKAYIQKRMTVYNMSERFQYRLIKEDAKGKRFLSFL